MYEPAVDRRPQAGAASSAAGPKRRAGYALYDPLGQNIGRAEEVFANADGEPMHLRVRIGFFGTRTVLIPGLLGNQLNRGSFGEHGPRSKNTASPLLSGWRPSTADLLPSPLWQSSF